MTARTRKIRHTAKPRIGKYLVFGGAVITIALIAAFVVAGINLAKSWLEDLPDWSDADAYILAEPTRILDADGNLIAELYLENRTPITIDQCSQWILEATVDVEDERFYSHNGIDMRGIMRAVVSQLTGGSEGASTITQQLVRNTVLKDEQFEKTLSRKVREAYIATELEKLYTKDEILMMYLNSIFYGEGCYGIEAAAQTYFGKSCSELTLAEAATLAGLPQSPSAYNPIYYPENAIERRNAVLGRMLSCGSITQEQYDEAVASQLELNVTKRRDSGAIAYPYFVNYVMGVLRQQFSTDTIFKGGLTVQTTISPAIQELAEDAVWSVLGDADESLEAALVCIEPQTGHILAMVGGRDFEVDEFNLATQAKRQPGSCFKVFTLAAAIKAGMSPNVLISGASPMTVGDWTLNNVYYTSYGALSLREATWASVNTVYAQVIHESAIGPQAVADTAYDMGITSTLQAYDSLTLGTSGVSVLEMASAYGTLATGGVHYDASCITQVLDRHGNVLYQEELIGTQALSPEVAGAVTDVLQGVINGGSMASGSAAALTVNQPVAGKTGTTEERKDLWFCGYTPQLSCAVWVGYRNSEETVYYHGSEGTTAALPCPIFSRFISSVLGDLPRQEFPSAGQPVYQSDWSWECSLGTWTEPVVEEEETATEEESTTTTTPSEPTYDEPVVDDPAYTEPSGGEESSGDDPGYTETVPEE